jgi:hypothetical protein
MVQRMASKTILAKRRELVTGREKRREEGVGAEQQEAGAFCHEVRESLSWARTETNWFQFSRSSSVHSRGRVAELEVSREAMRVPMPVAEAGESAEAGWVPRA